MTENKHKNTANIFEVTCPWCAQKGRYTVVRYSTVEGSTGICPECDAVLRADAGLPPKERDHDQLR